MKRKRGQLLEFFLSVFGEYFHFFIFVGCNGMTSQNFRRKRGQFLQQISFFGQLFCFFFSSSSFLFFFLDETTTPLQPQKKKENGKRSGCQESEDRKFSSRRDRCCFRRSQVIFTIHGHPASDLLSYKLQL